jgi:sRNA-binding regulator protein Hfq
MEFRGAIAIPSKSKAPAQTFEEAKYLRRLTEEHRPVRVKLAAGEVFGGVIEYWDTDFIRLNREDGPNLFIYKHDILYLWEENG